MVCLVVKEEVKDLLRRAEVEVSCILNERNVLICPMKQDPQLSVPRLSSTSIIRHGKSLHLGVH